MIRKVLWIILVFLMAVLTSASTLPQGNTVQIQAVDGTPLWGDYSRIEIDSAPTVFLMHMVNSDRSAWQPLIPSLNDAGYNTLAVDMRGHGESGGSVDWVAAQDDMGSWFDWLETQNDQNIAIIGASVGANLALTTCASESACITAIALSPGVDFYGVMPESALVEGMADRATLLVTSQLDRPSAYDTRQISWYAPGEIGIRVYPGAAHGTDLLLEEGESVTRLLLSWLDEHLPATSASPAQTATPLPETTATPANN